MFCAVVLVGASLAGFGTRPEPEIRIGRVIVEGNTATPDWAIMRFVSFHPGDRVRLFDLRTAENRLVASRLFQVGARPRIGPEVIALPIEIDTEFTDILIRVKEHPWSAIAWGTWGIHTALRSGDLDLLWSGLLTLSDEVRRRQRSGESP